MQIMAAVLSMMSRAAGKLEIAKKPGTQYLNRTNAAATSAVIFRNVAAVDTDDMQVLVSWQQQLNQAGFQEIVDDIWEAMIHEHPDPARAQQEGASLAIYHELHRRIAITLGMDPPETEEESLAIAQDDFAVDIRRGDGNDLMTDLLHHSQLDESLFEL